VRASIGTKIVPKGQNVFAAAEFPTGLGWRRQPPTLTAATIWAGSRFASGPDVECADMESGALLLTATITPRPGVPHLRVTDTAQRRQEYLTSLAFAMTLDPKIITTIVFAENSGADLSAFKILAERDDRVELLSVEPRPIEASWGRGYMETCLVLDAAMTSKRPLTATGVIWKTTGRYVVHNIARIVAKARPGKDLYVNLRTYPRPWVDMWVYGTTAHGLQLLQKSLPAMPDTPDQPTEQRLYGIVRDLMDRGEQIQPRLHVEPFITGIRGWDGRPYNSVRQRAKWVLRSATKAVAPSIWI